MDQINLLVNCKFFVTDFFSSSFRSYPSRI